MIFLLRIIVCISFIRRIAAVRFDEEFVGHNLNQNRTAINPLEYAGIWENHVYHPSPDNWRFPFYTLFLDKFVNGDPSNDDANGTVFEHDILQTQLRHGGDVQGLIDSLDYLHGMGVKGLYLAGSPMINQPWGADGYSPLDLTLLDAHFGDIEVWRNMVTEVHNRDMYVVLDNTMATMGDLISFDGYENSSTPFLLNEHIVEWRNPRRQYLDFRINNEYNETCEYPRFWLDDGFPVGEDVMSQMKGCYNSEFDQYGDTEAFGVYPDWRRQLSKFASSQDRLREWVPSVRQKISHFSCLAITMLDIDGFRLDKATQITVDALADFSDSIRECARSVGKENFFIPGEITGGNTFGSIYLGRGRQPDTLPENLTAAVQMTNSSNSSLFIREYGKTALDSGAFHYSTYRALVRFLGMDGYLSAGFDVSVDWVDAWNEMLITNDLVNANTNQFDPRHMYGVSNQDVFRWPAIKNGTDKWLLGNFITTLLLPGIPLLLWGEEQGFYVLDNTARNYVFGRQAMSSALAWEVHGCFQVGSAQYYKWDEIVEAATYGCNDPWNSRDHRDPSHPVRNIIKSMFQMRLNFPVLNDGFFIQSLSKQTKNILLPGSSGVPTETGMWSRFRGQFSSIQNLSEAGGAGDQSIWLVYQNDNTTINYQFDCSGNDTTALIAPFAAGTIVKNLFYPYEEHTLRNSSTKLGLEGSDLFNGCLDQLELQAWGYKAFVRSSAFVQNQPMITKFLPGHDLRLLSTVAPDQSEDIAIELHFSAQMECDSITSGLILTSKTENGGIAVLDDSTVNCGPVDAIPITRFEGSIPTMWIYRANLTNVFNGVHSVTVNNASAIDGTYTGTRDRFLFRTGQLDNPIVFPRTANYTSSLLHQSDNGSLYLSHKAAGADSWRYTLDWTHYSDWMPYTGGNSPLDPLIWSGTSLQTWEGQHVIVQYHNIQSGSSDYFQHGDLDRSQVQRRFPHMFVHGPFNQYGFDAGLDNEFVLESAGRWVFNFMTEWPAILQFNVWGMNPDKLPDQTFVYGDADGDSVLDRLPPSSLAPSIVNITTAPPAPYLGWKLVIHDGTLKFDVIPMGNRNVQIGVFLVMWLVPIITALLGIWAYIGFFYKVKFNQNGISRKVLTFPQMLLARIRKNKEGVAEDSLDGLKTANVSRNALNQEAGSENRRTVLIATIEYDIEDWGIKIKIGGLGVMAQLMGRALGFQDLIWVVPCMGGVVYPIDEAAESMYITILGKVYEVQVQYHRLRNITYVLLDAPVFRARTKEEPYPFRMDDLDSAVYYSSWNQCIAQTMDRFPIDLYHVNDYHGAVAPLHLLPERTIPICLSLHNAEFQGLWPLRSFEEFEEVCGIFNLPHNIVQKYVQFGDVFNLLHAGSSYLRVHQKGFGAVGVSKKYGARSHARYPIFWGLDKIGQLPNPDPSDTADWDENSTEDPVFTIDEAFEDERPVLRRQAQEWAGLDLDPEAELLVFVGRWSMQKGIDLIADVMPAILEEYPHVQLMCIGPVIDLYGKFAALKLDVMTKKYPGRVFSKPEFTALPPFVFSGAEFALIPSRDEPFGLVAVEFGRKGALGIGARVGGLGQMPGWWFTIESPTTAHLLQQFTKAIMSALSSDVETRRLLRATSAKQRFPVAEWVLSLRKLQSQVVDIHQKENPDTPMTQVVVIGPKMSFSPYATGTNTPKAHSRPGTAKSRKLTKSKKGHGVDADDSDDDEETRVPSSPPLMHTLNAIIDHNAEPTLQIADLIAGRQRPTSIPIRPRSESLQAKEIAFESKPKPFRRRIHGFDKYFDPVVHSKRISDSLSLDTIVGGKTNFELQKIDPDFTDSRGAYYAAFENNLDKLSGDNSTDALCIEEYLVRSEREWYSQFKSAKLGRFTPTATATATATVTATHTQAALEYNLASVEEESEEKEWTSSSGAGSLSLPNIVANSKPEMENWQFGTDFKPPTGMKLFMQLKIGQWPVYSFFMALGQIIAASSYQITLISGTIGQTAEKLYVVASIYLVTSVLWWVMYRTMKSIYVLSIPFFFYGLAFLLLGTAPFATGTSMRGWMQNSATAMYAVASSSGSIFFSLNFGDEGGSPIKSWIFRACIIQGTQQIYVCILWAWGSFLTRTTANSIAPGLITTSNATLAGIGIPIAVFFWVVGVIMYTSLPPYYHQKPGQVPSFYLSLFRRKIVIWFFVVVIIQNFFLSTLTGRNWAYLWSSSHASVWQIVLLIILFFVILWAAMLWGFAVLSRSHSWILPLFAIGLGAPRWAQILWSCSNFGAYVPWAGSAMGSALLGRALWLWLGVLDALQGVGFGMILLQTLTRIHMCYVLIVSQILGSISTIVARAVAPNKIGPGDVFPDFTQGAYPGVEKAWFWVGLTFQLLICVGFFVFFRKEQLNKP